MKGIDKHRLSRETTLLPALGRGDGGRARAGAARRVGAGSERSPGPSALRHLFLVRLTAARSDSMRPAIERICAGVAFPVRRRSKGGGTRMLSGLGRRCFHARSFALIEINRLGVEGRVMRVVIPVASVGPASHRPCGAVLAVRLASQLIAGSFNLCSQGKPEEPRTSHCCAWTRGWH